MQTVSFGEGNDPWWTMINWFSLGFFQQLNGWTRFFQQPQKTLQEIQQQCEVFLLHYLRLKQCVVGLYPRPWSYWWIFLKILPIQKWQPWSLTCFTWIISPWRLFFVETFYFTGIVTLRYILQLRIQIIWMGWLDENIDIERCGYCFTVFPMLQSRETYLRPLQNSFSWK